MGHGHEACLRMRQLILGHGSSSHAGERGLDKLMNQLSERLIVEANVAHEQGLSVELEGPVTLGVQLVKNPARLGEVLDGKAVQVHRAQVTSVQHQFDGLALIGGMKEQRAGVQVHDFCQIGEGLVFEVAEQGYINSLEEAKSSVSDEKPGQATAGRRKAGLSCIGSNVTNSSLDGAAH